MTVGNCLKLFIPFVIFYNYQRIIYQADEICHCHCKIMSSNSAISEFIELTSCTKDEAMLWLKLANSDVATALDLYFNDNKGQSMQTSNRTASMDEDFDDSEKDYSNFDFYDEDIRKADPIMTSNLIGNRKALTTKQQKALEQYEKVQIAAQFEYAQKQSIFNGVEEKANNKHDQTLADLFKPNAKLIFRYDIYIYIIYTFPYVIVLFIYVYIYRGDFQSVRDYGKHHNKWILICIHSDAEFTSHVLNRCDMCIYVYVYI